MSDFAHQSTTQALPAGGRLDADHPALQGHFPGDPILPGVSILAAVLEAIEAIDPRGPPIAHCSWRVAKFHSPVRPGDELSINIEVLGDGLHAFTANASTMGDDRPPRRVADGRVTVTFNSDAQTTAPGGSSRPTEGESAERRA